MNREEIYFDCWTNSASGVRNLSWLINGARIREGVEMSYDEEVTHSGVTVAAGEGVDKLGQQVAGEEVDEQNDDHGKKVFDPVKEHLSWNPVRGDMGGIEGWLSLANERKGKEREIDSYSEKKPDTALQRVRHLLDQWV